MRLIQTTMFGLAPEVIKDKRVVAEAAEVDVPTFDMDAWHKSIGGQWEQVQEAMQQQQVGEAQ